MTLLARILLSLLVLGSGAVALAQGAPPVFRSTRIVVESRGHGPDVILVPGLASTPEIWRRTADRLDDRYRVHLVSIRGFGSLPAGSNGAGAVGAPVAAEIRRYIQEQRLVRPALIGHSMGGQIVLRVAADQAAGAGRVMVVDSSPFFPALIRPDATAADVEPVARLAYQAVQFLDDATLRGQGRAMGVELGGAADTLFDTMGWQGGDRRVLAQGLYEVMTVDLRPRLRDIRVPVTVVYGWSPSDRSPRRTLDAMLRQAYRGLPTPARFEPVAGAEHMVMIDQPTRFAAAVDRFLR